MFHAWYIITKSTVFSHNVSQASNFPFFANPSRHPFSGRTRAIQPFHPPPHHPMLRRHPSPPSTLLPSPLTKRGTRGDATHFAWCRSTESSWILTSYSLSVAVNFRRSPCFSCSRICNRLKRISDCSKANIIIIDFEWIWTWMFFYYRQVGHTDRNVYISAALKLSHISNKYEYNFLSKFVILLKLCTFQPPWNYHIFSQKNMDVLYYHCRQDYRTIKNVQIPRALINLPFIF